MKWLVLLCYKFGRGRIELGNADDGVDLMTQLVQEQRNTAESGGAGAGRAMWEQTETDEKAPTERQEGAQGTVDGGERQTTAHAPRWEWRLSHSIWH